MRSFLIIFAVTTLLFMGTGSTADAQMPSGSLSTDDHTAREEAEGKVIWQKLQAKEVACADLSEEDFGALGEYYMGQMMGDSHAAMNAMMTRMMGEEGEEAMHVAMGKRLSGCDASAAFPSQGIGFMPMMQMMGNWGQNSMWPGEVGSWPVSLVWFVWLIVGILAVIWLWKQIVKK
ncbi:MAG: hypothetical protein HY603_00195 [Parcubacteria group bacterium]|nr:hypothetical protein [Parcubacteria group bacterium]